MVPEGADTEISRARLENAGPKSKFLDPKINSDPQTNHTTDQTLKSIPVPEP